jgi:hypothetical protein
MCGKRTCVLPFPPPPPKQPESGEEEKEKEKRTEKSRIERDEVGSNALALQQ